MRVENHIFIAHKAKRKTEKDTDTEDHIKTETGRQIDRNTRERENRN